MSEPQLGVSQALSSAIVFPHGRAPVAAMYVSAERRSVRVARPARIANALPSSGWTVGPDGASFMINYRVKDLDGVIAALRKEGVTVDPKIEELEYGRFGWVVDPEGNRIELWEPPKANRAPEKSIPME